MKKFLLFLCLGVVSCKGSADTATLNSQALTLVSTCADPAAYGAVPNDGIDDGPAFRQAAATGAQHICAGAGAWTVNYFRFASITLGQGQDLTGVGPATVIDMTGDAHGGAWWAIQLNGGSLRNLTVVQHDLTNPDNAGQNHAIDIGAGDASVVQNVTIIGPGVSGFGDCIRLLGTDATHQVQRYNVTGVVALGCSRDGISFQHDVGSGSVVGSTFESIGDNDNDYEPTSAGAVRTAFTGNVFLHPATNHAASITLSDSDTGNETVFTGNLILNGNVQMTRGDGVTFEGNALIGDPVANTSTYDVIRNSTGMRIIGNYIYRPSTAAAGYLVRFNQNNGGLPQHGTILGNRLVQMTQSYTVYLEGASRMRISGNDITNTAWPTGYAVGCTSVAGSCDLVNIHDNTFESVNGTTKGAIFLGGWNTGPTPIGTVMVTDNIGRGYTYGVLCSGPFTGPVRIDDNILGGTVACTGASVGWNN